MTAFLIVMGASAIILLGLLLVSALSAPKPTPTPEQLVRHGMRRVEDRLAGR